MIITALVMAGGKGTRMALPEEKPLLNVGGKPAIDYVIEALKQAKRVDSVVVAVTDYTPKTAAHLRDFPVIILKTPGKEYVSDMGYAVHRLNLQIAITISSDMPFITGKIIDNILDHFDKCKRPALTVAVPAETKQKLGMGVGYAFECNGKNVVPTGINVNDGAYIDEPELDQEVYVVDKWEVAVNINTLEELEIAQRLMSQSKL